MYLVDVINFFYDCIANDDNHVSMIQQTSQDMTTLLTGNLIIVGCKMIWVMTVYAWVILLVHIYDIKSGINCIGLQMLT